MEKRNKRQREAAPRLIWILSAILTAVFVLVIYVTHRAVPFMMDDLWYSTMLSDETPIRSLADIVESQIWHYFNWGGRSMTHGILQLTLLAGEGAADLLNVAVTLLLTGMVCVTAENRRLPAFFAAAGMMLGLNANWRMSMFWQAGAANYLYITVFILLFAWCYLREVPDGGSCLPWRKGAARENLPSRGESLTPGKEESVPEKAKGVPGKEESVPGKAKSVQGKEECVPEKEESVPGKAKSILENAKGVPGKKDMLPGITFWVLPLGILTGWSNENMGPAMWLLSLAVICLTRREGRKVRLWMVLGNLACLAGSAVCILAPGNFVRSAQAGEAQYGLVWRIFLRCYGESRGALEYLFPAVLVLFFLCVLYGKPLGRRNELLLFCALLSWGAFVLSPHYPDRASFGTLLLCICVILSVAGKILRGKKELAWPLWGIAAFIWLRGMYFCGEYLAVAWGWIR